MFAGNNPVNYADPSGLSLQGYPLGGGYSGNVTKAPTINTGYLPGISLVDTATAIYRGVNAIAPYAKSFANSALNSVARTLASSLVSAPPPSYNRETLRLAPAAEDAVVRQIVQGRAIVPRPRADLPGVSAALQDPSRSIIHNHNDLGYEILNPDGSVRSVSGSDYLPITENYRRAHVAAQSDAFRARAIDLYGEAIISLSPIVETARDGMIAGFGYDLYNPDVLQTEADQNRAGQMFFLPGFNSKQVKHADEALDALQDYRRARNQADAVAQDLLEQRGMRETRSIPGIRPGSNGNLDHQSKVLELERRAMLEAGPGETVLIQRQVQQYGSKRIPDVQIVDPSGRTRKVFEAERLPNGTRNINRESEYRRLGIPFETHELD
jgi:hypothetical protein